MCGLKTNEVEKLDIRQFKKAGLLNGINNASVTFSDHVSAYININAEPVHGYMHISMDDKVEEEKRGVQIRLETTRCNYGGYRFWFECGGTAKTVCNERVGVLYRVNNEFACQQCHGLTYPSRSYEQVNVFDVALKETTLLRMLEEMRPTLKKLTHAGKPTKRLIKYNKLVGEYNVVKKMTDERLGLYGMKI